MHGERGHLLLLGVEELMRGQRPPAALLEIEAVAQKRGHRGYDWSDEV
jgi:hypothetical protein